MENRLKFNLKKISTDDFSRIRVDFKENEFLSNSIGDHSIYLGDSLLCLEVDLFSGYIVGFNGYFCANNLEFKKVKTLTVKKDDYYRLSTIKSPSFIKGCGTRIEFKFKSLYDYENNFIVFGTFSEKSSYYRIFENFYVSVDNEGILESILISEIKLDI